MRFEIATLDIEDFINDIREARTQLNSELEFLLS